MRLNEKELTNHRKHTVLKIGAKLA
jgi:hypothetical protein